MFKAGILLFVVSISLAGCGDSKSNENIDRSSFNSHKSKVKVLESPKIKSFGAYKKNEITVPINDFVAVWIEDQNTLKIIQTPSILTEDEKNRLKGGENDFFVLSDKVTPNKEIWEWYPYIVTKLKFKSKEINSGNLSSFYIKAYGIEKANHTDNLNSYPSRVNTFSKLNYGNDQLIIEYSGNDEIVEDKHSWSIKID